MIDRTKLKLVFEIENEEVKQLYIDARNFLLSHSWCSKIESGYHAFSIAGVIGIFLFDIIPYKPEIDRTLWVVTGDLPPAYLVIDDADSWQEALYGYVYEMNRWIAAVRGGIGLDDTIPVEAEPTIEHAMMLEGRLKFLQKNLINAAPDSIKSDS